MTIRTRCVIAFLAWIAVPVTGLLLCCIPNCFTIGLGGTLVLGTILLGPNLMHKFINEAKS